MLSIIYHGFRYQATKSQYIPAAKKKVAPREALRISGFHTVPQRLRRVPRPANRLNNTIPVAAQTPTSQGTPMHRKAVWDWSKPPPTPAKTSTSCALAHKGGD
ncbi:hypothetical protein MRX96_055152 [Rhipicephalus microplus]